MSRPIQFSLVCILSLTTSCAFFAIQVSQAYAQQEGQSYEQSISEISIKIKDISRRLNANKALVASERDKLLGAEQALYKLDQSLQKIDYDLTRNQNQYKALGLQISLAKDSQTNNREGLKNLLISRYKQGKPDLIKQFLNQENPYAVGRLNNYYGYFSRALKIRFTLLAKQSSELLILEEEQSVAINRLEDERTKKTKLASVIVRSKQHRTSLIVKLDKKIVTNAETLEKLKSDRARLQSLLLQLKKQTAELKRIDQLRAKQEVDRLQQAPSRSKQNSRVEVARRLPVKGGFLEQKGHLFYPVSGRPSREFGSRLAESGMRSEGTFFDTRGSVTVRTIFRGQVLFADFLKGFGLLVIIDHGDNHISLYGHNERLLKKVGDNVNSGEAIANSGMTGGLKSHGLYFEIRHNTMPIDASKWCR